MSHVDIIIRDGIKENNGKIQESVINVILDDKNKEFNCHEFNSHTLKLKVKNKNYKKNLDYEYLGGDISKELKSYGEYFVIDLEEFGVDETAYIINGFYLGSYELNLFKTKSKPTIKSVEFKVKNAKAVEDFFLTKLKKVSDGNLFARKLCYLPPNVLTPKAMTEEISQFFKNECDVTVEVLDVEEIKKRNMNLLYNVAMGSINKPYVVIMTKGKDPKVALLGKGVTFDTGGISLKPTSGMVDMKKDMGGAAAVIGAVYASEAPVMGVVGLVENMIGQNAQRVSDIWTAMSGDTVEILNTDAEGRLVLADLMTLTQTYSNINTIVDLATLTGAVGVALGKIYGGLMSNSQSLTLSLIESGKETGDLLWSLPCNDEYNYHLESQIADIKNVGERGDAVATAGAKFIEYFLKNKDIRWAHIDIASVIDKITSLSHKNCNGYGVRLLHNLIKKITEQNCCLQKENCTNAKS